MTKVLFFGKLSDELGLRAVELPSLHHVCVNDVVEQLVQQQGAHWQQLLTAKNIIAAVDKTIINDRTKTFEHIGEIAFFPPVTGG